MTTSERPGPPGRDDPSIAAYYASFSGARSQALLRALTSVLWVADPEGRFTSPQILWSNYTGQSWEEQQGFGWLNAIHPDDRPHIVSCLEGAKQRLDFYYAEARLWHASSQSYRCYEARGVPIFAEDGKVIEWVGTCKDVHEQKEAERALRKADQQKDEFISILAHELRNPLAPIRNAVHILKGRGNADMQLNWVRDVLERQVSQMARLLDDLLDVRRLSQDKVELKKARITLDSVLDMAVETTRPLFEQKGQHLELGILSGPTYVEADALRLAQVFANLLNNAAKFTDSGGRISLGLRTEPEFAVVTVKDNGIGIPPDMLTNVFNMFTQVTNAFGRSEGGLGIGLALAKALTEMHGGTIEVRSEGLGHGSEFIVKIPLAKARALPTKQPSVDKDRGKPLRILVADDNPDACETLGVLLELMGHDVRLTRDGREALSECRANKPDVAILDIGMPKMSGYEVAQSLRSEMPGIFLIAASGWAQVEDLSRSKASGFDRHLVKPLDPDELSRVLAEFGSRGDSA